MFKHVEKFLNFLESVQPGVSKNVKVDGHIVTLNEQNLKIIVQEGVTDPVQMSDVNTQPQLAPDQQKEVDQQAKQVGRAGQEKQEQEEVAKLITQMDKVYPRTQDVVTGIKKSSKGNMDKFQQALMNAARGLQ